MQHVADISARSRSLAAARLCLGAALGLLLAEGCGGKPPMKEGFAEAYGTVTLDGQPLANAQVIFHTEKGDSYGRTDADGYYELENTRTIKGAGIGPATVQISTATVFPDEAVNSQTMQYNPETESYVKPERIPDRFRGANSELTVDVTENGAPYDFALVSEPEQE